MTNIRCGGNKEIDLLAIDAKALKKFHVESRVSTVFKLELRATLPPDSSSTENSHLSAVSAKA
jgi:hypothetical protein